MVTVADTAAEAYLAPRLAALAPEKIAADANGRASLPILHEFVARLVVSRLTFMNRQLELRL